MPSLPRPGDRLAGFRIERELGHGTTGAVLLAHQEGLGRRVALKVVGRPLAGDPAFRERFRREARAAAGLDHPNVVQVLGTGEDDDHLWLAMRLVDGPDLRVLLRRTGRLDPEQAVAVVEQIAAALDAAHAAGLVHRDVKPANVLIEDGPGRDLHVELADFGLARAPGVDDPEGTPGYAAPEQLAGAEAGPSADVFALGCVLYELLTGVAPPAAPRSGVDDDGRDRGAVVGEVGAGAGGAAHAALLPLTPSAALPRLGGAFDPTVERATDPDPAARFASAGELAMWARAALTVPRSTMDPPAVDPVRAAAATPATLVEVGPAAPTWEILPARRRRRGLLVAVPLVLLLALLGTAFVFLGTLGDAHRDPRAGTTPGTPTPPGGPAGVGGRSGGTGAGGATAGGGAPPGRGATAGVGAEGGAPARGSTGSGTAGGRDSSAGATTSRGTASGAMAASPGASRGAGADPRTAGGSGPDGPIGGATTPAGVAADGPGAGRPSSAAVPDAGRGAPVGPIAPALPPVPAGAVRFGGGGWVLDLPAAEGWRQTATQELDGGGRLITRLRRPDAVRIVVEALPGRTAVVGVPGAQTFPVRLVDAGRTDAALYRGGRYAMCAAGVCAAFPANGANGGVLLVVGARGAAGAKRVARRAAAGLRAR